MLITSQRIQLGLFIAVLQTLLLSHASLAQTSQTIRQKFLDLDEAIFLPPESTRLEVEPTTYPPNPQELNLDQLPQSIQVKEITIVGNEILSETELAISQEPQQVRSKKDLRQIIRQINQAYRDRGYVTSGIFTAPQLESNGTLILTITEGKIEQVKVI
ncbi:MAG: POTRA domain-containing protein, partial [Cyanobacteria bacterium J06558_2]